MSISAVSSSTSLAQLLSTQSTSRSNSSSQASGGKSLEDKMSELQDAIDSGDIDSAKEAYQSILDGAPDGWEDSPMAADLEAVSDALDSGDVDAASAALTTVTDKMANGPQGAKGPQGPPPPPPPDESDSSSDTTTTSLYDALLSGTSTDETEVLGTLLDMTV